MMAGGPLQTHPQTATVIIEEANGAIEWAEISTRLFGGARLQAYRLRTLCTTLKTRQTSA